MKKEKTGHKENCKSSKKDTLWLHDTKEGLRCENCQGLIYPDEHIKMKPKDE